MKTQSNKTMWTDISINHETHTLTKLQTAWGTEESTQCKLSPALLTMISHRNAAGLTELHFRVYCKCTRSKPLPPSCNAAIHFFAEDRSVVIGVCSMCVGVIPRLLKMVVLEQCEDSALISTLITRPCDYSKILWRGTIILHDRCGVSLVPGLHRVSTEIGEVWKKPRKDVSLSSSVYHETNTRPTGIEADIKPLTRRQSTAQALPAQRVCTETGNGDW
ncbi:uncharacterized protein LOC143483118 isoform X2 [Brachyhypopomus gauderio]|uniref:uncharacterized protein LOC143483118 isoform X2 n=1 Tax=Brachyhypopomus gauderio TaxID=698409 RepID=UPI0040432D50